MPHPSTSLRNAQKMDKQAATALAALEKLRLEEEMELLEAQRAGEVGSLKVALEMLLNGPCYHMFELWQHPEDVSIWQSAVDGNSIDWPNFLKPWKATVDWPGAPLFDRMAEAFPDALVLLSTRDPESWYESINSTIFMIMREASEEDGNKL